MTVSSQQSYVEYNADGSTTTFTVPFYFLQGADLGVTIRYSDNTTIDLTYGVNFSASGAGNPAGGSVTLNAAYPAGNKVLILRSPPATQETQYAENGKFPAKSHEKALDKLTMLVQQWGYWWDNLALKRPNFYATYYDAKQNKISNLADPAAQQDAVNNRSMRDYVDRAVAGVVGGFGWFIQAGAGAVYRTFQSKMRDVYSVKDFGAVGDGSNPDSAAFIAAATAAGEGGKVIVPAGRYSLTGPINVIPVNFIGDGQGSTILEFNNSVSRNGIVFSAPTLTDIEFGARDLSIKTIGGHGDNAFYTPRGVGLNGLRPKPTFQRLSFFSENTGDAIEGFSQVYSWTWMFNLGDSWNLSIDDVDAAGSYKPTVNPASQFLDGFIRTAPQEGILSMRVKDITTHNVAKFFELKQKTYFQFTDVDVARSLDGIYDAPDRVYETNRYAYGESIWTNVIINAQRNPVNLENRFLLIANGLAIHRAGGGFDSGAEWVGLRLVRPRVCTFQGLEIGSASGYTGVKKGILIDGGDANNFTNVSFGTLDVGAQVGITASVYGSNQATNFNNVSINANVTTLFNVQNARRFNCDQYGSSPSYTLTNFMVNDDAANNTLSLSNIDGANQYTDNSIFLYNQAGGTDAKRLRIDTRTGYTLSTQTDTGATGNNAHIIRRTGVVVDSMELRTKTTTGGFILLTTPESQFSGLIKPTTDNANSNGTSAFRWSQVYAGAGAINTSNEEVKIRVEDEGLKDAEKAAALEIKSDIWRFRFKDAIDIKGDDARIHFGVGAQSVGNILRKHGLDPDQYAFWCYDEWDDIYGPEIITRTVTNQDTGESWSEEYATGEQVVIKPAGYQYGIRYEELLCFIMAAI